MGAQQLIAQGLLLLAALTALVALHRARCAGRIVWDGGSWVVLLAGAAMSAPTMLAKLTGNVTVGTDQSGNRVLSEVGVAATVAPVGRFVVLGVGLFVLYLGHRQGRSSATSVLLFAAVAGLSVLSEFAVTGGISNQAVFLAVLLACLTFSPFSSAGAVSGGATFTILFACASAFYAQFNWALAADSCTRKCIALDTVFSGLTTHGNSMGLLMVLGLPLVWIAFSRWRRVVLVAFVVLVVVLTGSRTSAAVAAGVLVVLLSTNPGVGPDRAISGRRPWISRWSAAGAALLALLVGVTSHSDAFATGRGYLWRLAFGELDGPESWTFGEGALAWNRVFERGQIATASAYSAHNQWVETLLTTGLLGATVLAAALWLLLRHSTGVLLTGPVVVAIFASGVLERAVSFTSVVNTSWILVALVVIAADLHQDKISPIVPPHGGGAYTGTAARRSPYIAAERLDAWRAAWSRVGGASSGRPNF